MTVQAANEYLNEHLNVTLAVITLVIGLTVGHWLGKTRTLSNATANMQHALDRTARDVRLFRDRIYGMFPHSQAYMALVEAEQMIRWRINPANTETSPTGYSRLRDPDEPRSRTARKARERAAQRQQISFLGRNQRPDDTYIGPLKKQMARRYNRPAWEPRRADAETTT